MAKRQVSLASLEKEWAKDPNRDSEGELRATVAEELKDPGVIREMLKEGFDPSADRLGLMEDDVQLIGNNFDNMQTAIRNAK